MKATRIKASKKCMACKRELPWTRFSIVWGPTQAASFLRRTCQDCEGKIPIPEEARHLEAELRRLQSQRLKLIERCVILDERIDERLQQLETARSGISKAPQTDETLF